MFAFISPKDFPLCVVSRAATGWCAAAVRQPFLPKSEEMLARVRIPSMQNRGQIHPSKYYRTDRAQNPLRQGLDAGHVVGALLACRLGHWRKHYF